MRTTSTWSNTCVTPDFEIMPLAPGVMHVMAGVLLDDLGRVLLAQRPPGKHLAGLWEFPGGKLEVGEAPSTGLARELREELGITVRHAKPLIAVPWVYGERKLLLDAWCIGQWDGVPQSMEGQALQWLQPTRINPTTLTPADRPILQALLVAGQFPLRQADTDAPL